MIRRNRRTDEIVQIDYRPMEANDVGTYPIGCQGEADVVRARINDLSASAILAFDGSKHVGQLHFRRFDAELRAPNGIWTPDYWGDFGDNAPDPGQNALSIFCYHVGQTDESDDRDEQYFGQGIGGGLLDFFLKWAEQKGFDAVVAKATPEARPVMTMMGGQPASVYLEHGFKIASEWIDDQLREVVVDRGLVQPDADVRESCRISCCVKEFSR